MDTPEEHELIRASMKQWAIRATEVAGRLMEHGHQINVNTLRQVLPNGVTITINIQIDVTTQIRQLELMADRLDELEEE